MISARSGRGRHKNVLFLTDSVFRVLFAYFDESMSSIGGYES